LGLGGMKFAETDEIKIFFPSVCDFNQENERKLFL